MCRMNGSHRAWQAAGRLCRNKRGSTTGTGSAALHCAEPVRRPMPLCGKHHGETRHTGSLRLSEQSILPVQFGTPDSASGVGPRAITIEPSAMGGKVSTVRHSERMGNSAAARERGEGALTGKGGMAAPGLHTRRRAG